MARIAGKVAVVTGAGAGIGRAMAQRFVQEGARVIAVDLDTVEPVPSGTGDNAMGSFESWPCDVSDPAAVEALFAHVHARYGRLDVLANNAGIGPTQRVPTHEVTLTDWDRVIDVNQRGAFLMMRSALVLMMTSGGGSIINTASVGAFSATTNSIAYLASKGALLMMTRAAALEYRPHRIRVNAICPGMTRTSIFEGLSDESMASLLARTSARMIEPHEVASLALFLASDEAAGITGAMQVIDDGRTAGA
ncbi:SDR family NAD(P)-dependent oxidoreductase [Pseudomonas sp. NPDC089392]|uniref:SDR family NAD(P)-dependent oxidoreductase n=1 Tax=Pseudomonas sp. NPDC089392 TaxID=3364459 RepID=UPI00382E9178